MQSVYYPSQDKIQTCVRELFVILLPDQEFKSFHDLFNAQKFHKLFASLVNGMNEQFRHKLPDLKLFEDSQSQSYNDMKRKQFRVIAEQIRQVEEILGIAPKRPITEKDINNMVERSSFRGLHKFLEHLFQMFKFNQSLLHQITSMDQDMQQIFFQVMQTYQNLGEFEDSDNELSTLKISSKINRNELDENQLAHLEEIQNELQSHIQMKEEEIKELKFNKEQLEEEMEQFRRQIQTKNQQLQVFKKRMLAYQQIDQLMIQKDQQITKLTKKLTERELKSRLKQSQLTNQNKHLQQRIAQLQFKELQIAAKYQKQKQINQSLNKQKEESEASMKKVINNLKEKNKSMMDKINDLQKEIIEVNFQKQMRDKELQALKSKMNQPRKPTSTSVFDSLQSPRSPLKEDLNQQLGSVRGNYSKLGQQLSLDLDRADFQDQFGHLTKDNNKRFNELLQQNYILKQQLHKIQSSTSLDSKQVKDLQDEVQKMKKKINILKRRNDEIQNQRKEEIDVMVGIMQLYAGSLTGSQAGKK